MWSAGWEKTQKTGTHPREPQEMRSESRFKREFQTGGSERMDTITRRGSYKGF